MGIIRVGAVEISQLIVIFHSHRFVNPDISQFIVRFNSQRYIFHRILEISQLIVKSNSKVFIWILYLSRVFLFQLPSDVQFSIRSWYVILKDLEQNFTVYRGIQFITIFRTSWNFTAYREIPFKSVRLDRSWELSTRKLVVVSLSKS